jgi:uncharacterized UPF0160 family protein
LETYNTTEDKRIIVLDKSAPWPFVLIEKSEPVYVVFPDTMTHTWRVQAIPRAKNTYVNRKDFPENWGGLSDKKLEEVSGVVGAQFCHRSLHLLGAQNKESALQLAKIALES